MAHSMMEVFLDNYYDLFFLLNLWEIKLLQ